MISNKLSRQYRHVNQNFEITTLNKVHKQLAFYRLT